MVIKFNPQGRVVWVFGRRQESADERCRPWEHVDPPLAACRRTVPPADRRRVGLRGQHLHQRRLHQFARRQIRSQRRLGEVVGREGHRARASSNCRTPSPSIATTTSMSATAPTGACRCSTPRASSCACSPSTCRRCRARRPSTATTPTGARLCRSDRRAQLDLHQSRPEIRCCSSANPHSRAGFSR